MQGSSEVFPAYERPKMPQWAVPSMYLCLAFAIYLPRSTFNTLATLPFLLATTLNIFRYQHEDANTNYSLATWTLLAILVWLDRLVLSNEHELEYVGRAMVDPITSNKSAEIRWSQTNGTPASKNTKQVDKQSKLSSRIWNSRILHACSLAIAPRGIGYRWQVKGVYLPNRPIPSRWKFIGRQIPRVVFYVAAADILGTICAATADKQTWNPTPLQRFLVNVVLAWAMAFWMGFGLLGVYFVAAIVTVAIRLTDPWQWPDLFGDWTECYTVRTFWSSSYHQLLRRVLQSPAIWLCRILGFEKGSLLSRYAQLYIVFFLSGVVHAGGSYNMLVSFNLAFYKCLDFQIMFAQAFAITFEDIVIWLWLDVLRMRTHFGKSIIAFEKAAGFLWTIVFLTASIYTFVDRQQRFGFMQTRFGSRNASWQYLKPIIDRLKPL